MRVVLRRRLADELASGRQRFDQTVLDVSTVTIGRGVDRIIQIPDARIDVEHGVIDWRRGRLELRARRVPIAVNGRRCRRSFLQTGDVLELAGRHVTIEALRPDGVLVLRVGLPVDEDSIETVPADPQSLKAAGLRASPVTSRLVAGVLLLTLFLPLGISLDTPLRATLRAAALLPSDAFWVPGPLHTAHRSIGANCNACHVASFKKVANESCGVCHAGVQHHVAADSPVRPIFAAMRCAGCHDEHDKSVPLIDADSRTCTNCHANLRKLDPHSTLKDATDFGHDHPAFSPALLTPALEHTNLKFSHQVHLEESGVNGPNGKERLHCGDCHIADASGRHMQPIRMESHCARCHQLQFDEHDPTTAVPHGDLNAVFTALVAHFSRRFLEQSEGSARSSAGDAGDAAGVRRRPGGEAAVLSRDEQRRSLAWADRESLRAATELLDKRVCVECHTVSSLAGKSGFERWHVEPVKLTESWMPRAQFDHAAHRTSACTDCHSGAPHSELSSDVLMPGLQQCRTCHGGGEDDGKLASNCIMCHRLHVPGRGDLVRAR